MKKQIFTSFLFVIVFLACNNSKKNQTNTPVALESNSSNYSSFSKSKLRYEDLVDLLYEELLSQNVDLKQLEEDIQQIENSKKDSLSLFEFFDEKNKNYFLSAQLKISKINDSLLREQMNVLISKSLEKYEQQTTQHQVFLEIIKNNDLNIQDLKQVIKIVKTLPLIETYQSKNLPNSKSLNGFAQQQEIIIQQQKQLAK